MKKTPLLILVIFIFSSFSIKHDTDSSKGNIDLVKNPGDNITISLERIAYMKTREAEEILGTKMSLKEKLVFKLAQHKIKKSLKTTSEGKSSKGQTAFVLSLIGLCLLVVPYAGLASLPLAIIGLVMGSQAKKENPNDKKAQTAIILSLVTLGLIALAVLLVVAIIASGGFWVY